MARAKHTLTGIVADVPDYLITHPTLGQYLEVVDEPVDPDCKPCLEEAKAKAAVQEAEEVEFPADSEFLDAIDTDNEED